MPPKTPTVKENIHANAQGPIFLASTHNDFKVYEEVSTEHSLNTKPSSTTETALASTNEDDEASTSKPERHHIMNKASRQKSIPEELLISTSSESSSTTSSSTNNKIDSFQTEDYKITDLFPNVHINQTQSTYDSSEEDISTQSSKER